ncbi:putative F-box/LRR-repeat protein 23 [Heracleum sosnowskyi]|uniref:F-box/LRR-repeat protein 23 n=1 Tax=Heracleum sosnowskyi TaxID=360622 RepID=A0AAD8MK37_9APIA|nr:putative F-box/LRR-repeat protein 23 [Heracleum sosnowskyi]
MDVDQRNWLDLPDDVTTNILNRLSVIEILEYAQKVCTAWRRICKDPAMWRVIDMENLQDLVTPRALEKMCMNAIDRSQGQLVDLNIELFPTNDLIEFLAQGERSSQLRRLQISHGYGSLHKYWSDFFKKVPLLEEIALTFTTISEETVAIISQYCPMLKSFTYNNHGWKYSIGMNSADDFVIAVAKGMSQLLHLQLTGNEMSNKGLQAILDGCPNLQSLDIRGCFSINLNESCGKLCKERIKNLRLPSDSMEGHKVAPTDSEDDYEDYVWDDYVGLYDHWSDDDNGGSGPYAGFTDVVAEYYSLL